MTAGAPGQAARATCEAFWRVIHARDGLRNDPSDAWPWAQFQGAEEAWQAAADATAAAQEPQPAPGLAEAVRGDQLRERVTAVARGLEDRARVNHPSKVSQICDDIAGCLRRALDGH